MKPIATTRSATGIATGKLAIWWVLASEVVIFGGLLASYVMHRLGHPEWATAAGLHALHVIAGAVIMAIVANDARKNLELHRVELIGIYWHFVDVVWIFLFPLLYIAK